jgi:competence protein CoiA
MQLYAFDGTSPVSAMQAKKGENYFCPECQGLVRVRGGPHRQIHFYHHSTPKNCKQHQKSPEHLHLQIRFLKLIGAEESQIECPFPEIGRIADIAWHAKKIVFEIQCSPIALEEVRARNADYMRVGYDIIWILHDKRFNKNNLSAAEAFLRSNNCYYSNVDKQGSGVVYDQFEVLKSNRRYFRGPPLNISPHHLFSIPNVAIPDLALPESALIRISKWKYYAQGDLLHRLLKEADLSLSAKRMLALEKKFREKSSSASRLKIIDLLLSTYRCLFDLMLKRLTR